MREFFQEKLQVPIEFFNPLRNVAVAPEVNAEEIAKSAHLMGEVVGLALRAVTTCPVELNLRPPTVVRAQEVERRRPFLIAAAACIVLAITWLGDLLRARHDGFAREQRKSGCESSGAARFSIAARYHSQGSDDAR